MKPTDLIQPEAIFPMPVMPGIYARVNRKEGVIVYVPNEADTTGLEIHLVKGAQSKPLQVHCVWKG